ncbi:SHOCT domain-containing protein [Caldicellulosiruptoraceae bacterium PP1]
MMGYGYGMMAFGWILMLIPLALIGLIIYAAIRLANSGIRKNEEKYGETNRALELLNQKFANGEISEEEYKRKKDLLRQ